LSLSLHIHIFVYKCFLHIFQIRTQKIRGYFDINSSACGRLERFERDLEILVEKLRSGLNRREERTLTRLKDRLLLLRKKNLVKINHSVMELVLAKYLIKKGYQIELEHPLDETLVCDLYGVKGLGTLVVEK